MVQRATEKSYPDKSRHHSSLMIAMLSCLLSLPSVGNRTLLSVSYTKYCTHSLLIKSKSRFISEIMKLAETHPVSINTFQLFIYTSLDRTHRI